MISAGAGASHDRAGAGITAGIAWIGGAMRGARLTGPAARGLAHVRRLTCPGSQELAHRFRSNSPSRRRPPMSGAVLYMCRSRFARRVLGRMSTRFAGRRMEEMEVVPPPSPARRREASRALAVCGCGCRAGCAAASSATCAAGARLAAGVVPTCSSDPTCGIGSPARRAPLPLIHAVLGRGCRASVRRFAASPTRRSRPANGRRRIQRDAGGEQLSNAFNKPGGPVPVVQRDRDVRLVAGIFAPADSTAFGPDLEELARAVGVHGLDFGDELDRLHQVLNHRAPGRGDIGRMRLRARVRIHRHRRFLPGRAFDLRGQCVAAPAFTSAEWNAAATSAASSPRYPDLGQRLRSPRAPRRVRTGHHCLRRRVVVGDDDAVDVGDRPVRPARDRRAPRPSCQFAAFGARGVDDETAARRRQRHQRASKSIAPAASGATIRHGVAGGRLRRPTPNSRSRRSVATSTAPSAGWSDIGDGQEALAGGLASS